MRHALWYGHGSFMGLQIHALPVRIENTFPTITFYSPDYRSTLFRIHICQKVQRTALWRKHHFFTCVSIHYLYVYVRLSICSGSALHLLPLYRWRIRIRGILNQFKETAGAELTTSLNQFEEAIDLLSGLTPLEMTFQLISQNMFYGMLMAIPTALIVMRKKKNE